MNTIDYLKQGERLDDLQRNNLQIIQNPEKFCFGMDAVLLAHFSSLKKGDKVLDMGTGTGILPILMSSLYDADHYDALEIQEESADMADRSVHLNSLEDKIKITVGDIKHASELFGSSVFNAVTTNPPYMSGGSGLKNPDQPKAIARHEILCSLDDVIREASKVLKEKGRFYMVHRPFRLAEIMISLNKYHLEPKRMQLVYPYIDKEPNMVLIESVKGGNPMVKFEPPVIVYEAPGKYTTQIYDIYGY